MTDLLKVLGLRVRQLRDSKNWSQEEFAHIAGLHRTYAGQIERGEKNLSFANLVKVSDALGVTPSELLAGLEGGRKATGKDVTPVSGLDGDKAAERRLLEIQKVVSRLGHQRIELDRTIQVLEELTVRGGTNRQGRSGERTLGGKKK